MRVIEVQAEDAAGEIVACERHVALTRARARQVAARLLRGCERVTFRSGGTPLAQARSRAGGDLEWDPRTFSRRSPPDRG